MLRPLYHITVRVGMVIQKRIASTGVAKKVSLFPV